jgi:hypothetical protein
MLSQGSAFAELFEPAAEKKNLLSLALTVTD